ncbi:MAG TPA: hypothetical protein VHU23_04010 [Rhizomicrobium sp.]|jgi:hypothetical protein|nr:hypothetical protein [Rhizomicrobium sp.]
MKSSDNSKVYRYTSIAYVIDALSRREMTLLNPSSWVDKNDSLYISFYKQYRNVAHVFATCCTLSKETFQHWYIFGVSSAGAFIEYDRATLEACFEELKLQGHSLRFDEVQYLTLENVEKPTVSLESFPFLKRWGFGPEKEYRVIAETNNHDAISYPIPIPLNVIRRVVINPWLPRSVVDSLKARIRSIDGCEKLKVDHSRLIESDRWIAAGVRKLSGHLRTSAVPRRTRPKKVVRKKSV